MCLFWNTFLHIGVIVLICSFFSRTFIFRTDWSTPLQTYLRLISDFNFGLSFWDFNLSRSIYSFYIWFSHSFYINKRTWYLICYFVTPHSQNTYLDMYSDFSIVFFNLVSVFIYFMIIYVIVLLWIWIRGLGNSPSLNQGPDPNILIDLIFLVVRSDRF